ncbi:6800_t:CDS:2 [Entrophospora sp. SA101]|nr:6800_t:CDS:2 [Entrophospora sp. SA101]
MKVKKHFLGKNHNKKESLKMDYYSNDGEREKNNVSYDNSQSDSVGIMYSNNEIRNQKVIDEEKNEQETIVFSDREIGKNIDMEEVVNVKELTSTINQNNEHSEDMKFPCKHYGCSRSFKKESSLKRHQTVTHKGIILENGEGMGEVSNVMNVNDNEADMKFPCQHFGCNRRFRKESSLKRHQTVTHRGIIIHDGGKMEVVTKELTINEHSEDMKFPCEHSGCNRCFRKLSSLKRHQTVTHKGLIISRNVDGVMEEVVKELTTNEVNEHENMKFPCNYPGCTRSFKKDSSLKRHQTVRHKGMKPYKSKIHHCNKNFSSKHGSLKHGFKHKSDKIYKCKVCNKAFHSKTKLHLHSSKHSRYSKHSKHSKHSHSITDKVGPIVLKETQDIEKTVNNKSETTEAVVENNLAAVRNHSKKLDHNCSQKSLKKPFICDVKGCKKSFSNPQGLKYHYKSTHSGEKPFECDFEGCDRKFIQESFLKSHQRIHTGEKPFICNINGCKKSFAHRSGLKYHQNKITHEKRFACNVKGCKKSYLRESHFKYHQKQQHDI